MKPITIIAICVICAATLMSGCLTDDSWESKDDDGDGLKNGKEIIMGTDPSSKDTDRDGYFDLVDPNPLDNDIPLKQHTTPTRSTSTPTATPTPEVKYVYVTPTPAPTSATTTTYSGENGQNIRVGAYHIVRCGYGCNIDCGHHCEVYCGRGCNIDCGDSCIVRCGGGCNIAHGERCSISHGHGCNVWMAYPD